MSYVVNVVVPPVPAGEAEAHAFADALQRSAGAQPALAPALLKFHDAIARLFPCRSSYAAGDPAREMCPWSAMPLLGCFRGNIAQLSIRANMEWVLPAVLRCAAELGLTVLDRQAGKIHRSATFRVRLLGARDGLDAGTLATALVPLFKRTHEQILAMLAGPSVVLKRGIDDATAQRYLQILERAGCACAIEAEPYTVAAEQPAAPLAPPPPSPKADDEAMQRWLKHNKAGPAPLAEDADEAEAENARLARLVSGQRLVIDALLLNFLGMALKQMVTPRLLLLCLVAIGILSLVGILRMAAGLAMSTTGKVLTALASMVPVVGLIILLVMNAKATGRIREAGYTVGWLGVSAAECASMVGAARYTRMPSVAALCVVLLCLGLSR